MMLSHVMVREHDTVSWTRWLQLQQDFEIHVSHLFQRTVQISEGLSRLSAVLKVQAMNQAAESWNAYIKS